MTFQSHANLLTTNVVTAPSPATSGTSITVSTAWATKIAALTLPVQLVIAPDSTEPDDANAEIVTCTNANGGTGVLTITRAQEGSTARTVIAGDRIRLALTKLHLEDIEEHAQAGGLDARAYGTLTAASSGAAATNTATIEAAIAAAAASAVKTVLLPAGTYYVEDVQLDQAVTLRGHGGELTTLAYTSTTGYALTMSHGYAEAEHLRIKYAGSGSASAGGHLLWQNGRRLSNVVFITTDTTNKAYRYINHDGAPSANWRWEGCTFGGAASAVADCGIHLDQGGAWPMPGDGMISDCQFLDTVYGVPAIRVKGHPSLRVLNPKLLGWTVGVLIDWSNSLGNSNGFYWLGGSCENFTAAGLRVARSSGSYTLVDNIVSGVEFVPSATTSGIACIDIQDGSAPGWTITGNMMMPVFTNQIGVKIGSGADKVAVTGNFIRGAATGVSVNSGATNVYVAANYFQGCTTDVSDSGSVVAAVKSYNDANVKGYLHVGSLSAPTNTADGDITADQIYVPKVIGSKTDASGGGLTITTTDHATKGTITIGTTKYDEANNRLGIGMTPTVPLDVTGRAIFQGSHTDAAAFTCNGTVTTATNAVGQIMVVGGTIDGTGANPAAFRLSTTLAPASGTVASSYGLRLTPKFEPPSGATQSAVYGSLAQVQTGTSAGTVTALTCYYAGKVLGTQVPTTIVGMAIDNMGAAGVTNATGLAITKPTGATNNYYFSFDTADATAAGAYFGRIPVSYAGALKYLHIFSA